ncbi:MAG: endolytic transglycosylase MltG [Candidatus Pacebacteria bacterium]|nr:endolytic transglycosylase MltG [Candidatus Paceibacterota bacterium]
MGSGDEFKNFLIIKKIEEDNEKKSFLESVIENKLPIFIIFIALIIFIFFYNIFFADVNLSSLKNKNYLFQINNGESVSYVAEELKKENVINSVFAFKAYLKLFGKSGNAQAGIYRFDEKDSLISVANKIKNANYAIPPVRITIPEGMKNLDTANIISKSFLENKEFVYNSESFDISNIVSMFNNSNSFIWPDTYFFLPNTALSDVISDMQNNFYLNLKNIFISFSDSNVGPADNIKIYSLNMDKLKISDFFNEKDKTINLDKRLTMVNDIGTTTVTIRNIVTMASYLEGEANNEKDMRIVAGVLWSRLKIGFPLQIDAATSTYKIKGMTKNPINNPGAIAIKSAIDPISTGNIYYITGNDGKMYYAKDYNTHLQNIKKYLKN